MKKLLTALFFLVLIFAAQNTYSQKAYDLEGRYSVGKAYCTVEWSESSKAFRVYWDNGTGYTLLFTAMNIRTVTWFTPSMKTTALLIPARSHLPIAPATPEHTTGGTANSFRSRSGISY